jgi:hypothetical protein
MAFIRRKDRLALWEKAGEGLARAAPLNALGRARALLSGFSPVERKHINVYNVKRNFASVG